MCEVNIFSHSVDCLLITLTVCFKEHNFLISVKYRLSVILFYTSCFLYSKKYLPTPKSQRFFFSLCLFLEVLAFAFSFVLWFELIFEYDVT